MALVNSLVEYCRPSDILSFVSKVHICSKKISRRHVTKKYWETEPRWSCSEPESKTQQVARRGRLRYFLITKHSNLGLKLHMRSLITRVIVHRIVLITKHCDHGGARAEVRLALRGIFEFSLQARVVRCLFGQHSWIPELEVTLNDVKGYTSKTRPAVLDGVQADESRAIRAEDCHRYERQRTTML